MHQQSQLHQPLASSYQQHAEHRCAFSPRIFPPQLHPACKKKKKNRRHLPLISREEEQRRIAEKRRIEPRLKVGEEAPANRPTFFLAPTVQMQRAAVAPRARARRRRARRENSSPNVHAAVEGAHPYKYARGRCTVLHFAGRIFPRERMETLRPEWTDGRFWRGSCTCSRRGTAVIFGLRVFGGIFTSREYVFSRSLGGCAGFREIS